MANQRRLLCVALTVIAVLGLAAAPASAQVEPRAFDALATQSENGRWKHLGLKRDRYVIFDDRGVFEQGLIRDKWRFLPTSFTVNVDAAAIVLENRRWVYTFVQDDLVVTFDDSGIISHPGQPWGFLPTEFRNGLDTLSALYLGSQKVYAATRGEQVATFTDTAMINVAQLPAYVPPEFRSSLYDISVEWEFPAPPVFAESYYSGYSRIIVREGVINEWVDVRSKWPHLNSFFNATA